MAPEVIEHHPYREKADVFSFAITVWELLTARVPYAEMTPLQASALQAAQWLCSAPPLTACVLATASISFYAFRQAALPMQLACMPGRQGCCRSWSSGLPGLPCQAVCSPSPHWT